MLQQMDKMCYEYGATSRRLAYAADGAVPQPSMERHNSTAARWQFCDVTSYCWTLQFVAVTVLNTNNTSL